MEINDSFLSSNENNDQNDTNGNKIIQEQSKDLVNELFGFFDNEENNEEKEENNNIEENNKNENGATQENKIEDKKEEENKINNEEKKSEASNQNNIKEEKEKEKIKTPEKINHNKSKKKVASTKKINKPKNIKPQTAKKKNNNSIDDKVYSHNHYRNENIKNYIKQKESKEIGECSFKPKINKRIGYERNYVENNGIDKDKKENEDVVDRLMQWKDRVEKKKNDTKNKKDESATDGCTFNPKLNTEVPKFEDTKINGTKKYLERIKNSREMQKQKEEKLNPNYNDLYNKYYKKKEKTILDKNKKLTKKEYQNYLNVFPNVLIFSLT